MEKAADFLLFDKWQIAMTQNLRNSISEKSSVVGFLHVTIISILQY